MQMRYVTLFNQNQMRQIGCGYRGVFITEGRKWCRVFDWCTGDQSRINLNQLSEMGPIDEEPPRLMYLRRAQQRSARAQKMYRDAIEFRRAFSRSQKEQKSRAIMPARKD